MRVPEEIKTKATAVATLMDLAKEELKENLRQKCLIHLDKAKSVFTEISEQLVGVVGPALVSQFGLELSGTKSLLEAGIDKNTVERQLYEAWAVAKRIEQKLQ